ncbi:MAG: hypothetical protein LBF38_06310, partial [Deltaproteobacteria bacterium]|nr:hypothetical protein [Deltaproteobacteria bacterium]
MTNDPKGILNWKIDSDPATWIGVTWGVFNDTYHTRIINIDNKNLIGDLNLSEFNILSSLNANYNLLTSLDVSDNTNLTALEVS